VTWRAFDLHPEIPDGGLPATVLPAERWDLLEGLLGEAGLPFRRPERLPRTRPSLEAAEWVRERVPDAFPAFHRALFTAHWSDGADIGDPEVVAELAGTAGADREGLAHALETGVAAPAVDRSTTEGVEAGVTGTPAWLFAGRFLLPGAQPRDVLDRVVALLRERGIA
jgi:predicted DsbA family dithiol-disulfide isomerase